MKEVFQMLKDPRFHLVYGVTQRYSNGPEPRRVRLNREGYKLVEGVTKKALVYPRMRLAVHPSPLKGDAFSPIFGRITDVTERSLFVEAIEPDEALRALADGVEKVDLINDERTGQELAVLLKSLGLNTKSLGQQCETLIINGLNPDPGVTWAEPMLLTHQGTLRAGLAVLRRLSPAKRILLAVPREMHLHFDDVEVVRVTARYPASVDALLVKSVTGKEKPEGVGVVGLHNVWSLGRVARTGLPLIESVITLGSYTHSGNYIVKEGSMLGELLEFAKVYGNYYGTPKRAVLEKLARGTDVILEIDMQGALKVKENYPDGVFIFILPPSMSELRKRLTGRGTESAEAIELRLGETFKELSYIEKYDYCVVNGVLEEAVARVKAIVIAEHSKVAFTAEELIASYKEEL